MLALPRGGVPVAVQVARALHAPLDLLLVRKIGAPMQPELAVAAIVDGDPPELVDDEQIQAACGVSRDFVLAAADVEQQENVRRREAYLHGRAPLPLQGATAIVVDDGIATGTTVRAALLALRRRKPARLILAVRAEVDDIICLAQPDPFHAVGLHYLDFRQVDDDEVRAALDAVTASSR